MEVSLSIVYNNYKFTRVLLLFQNLSFACTIYLQTLIRCPNDITPLCSTNQFANLCQSLILFMLLQIIFSSVVPNVLFLSDVKQAIRDLCLCRTWIFQILLGFIFVPYKCHYRHEEKNVLFFQI